MTDTDVASWPVCTWAPDEGGDPNQLPGSAPVANVVDTNYTMLAGIPKQVLAGLGARAAFDGTHDSLRARGRAWLDHGSESSA